MLSGCKLVDGSTAAIAAEGTNYFLRQPNLSDDGFSYTPYSYPHPLSLAESH